MNFDKLVILNAFALVLARCLRRATPTLKTKLLRSHPHFSQA
ncbi:MAG: hypothetical protein V7K25_26720 [Nostoc sp.]